MGAAGEILRRQGGVNAIREAPTLFLLSGFNHQADMQGTIRDFAI